MYQDRSGGILNILKSKKSLTVGDSLAIMFEYAWILYICAPWRRKCAQ